MTDEHEPASDPVPDPPLRQGERNFEPFTGDDPKWQHSPPLVSPEEFRKARRREARGRRLVELLREYAEELRPVLREILEVPKPVKRAPPREPEGPKPERDWW